MTFEELKLTPPLLRAVEEAGYDAPSPIQLKAIPPVLAGRDLLGCAQTGTGKTAAFALPILQRLAAQQPGRGRRPIKVLVLTPTRELALQIQESFEAYGKHLPLRSTVIFGGVGQAPQVAQLQRGVDILVATPGRLNDLIGQGHIKLDKVEIFVLDEADRMLDMGFVQDVKKVIKHLPDKRQNLLFSATMPDEIVKLASTILRDPAKVFVTPPATTVEKIEQHLYKVDKPNKRHLLASLLRRGDVSSALVFTRTKHGADRVVRELKKEGINALAIHGNKSQTARQNALERFKDGKVQALIATDIAARGLDINELSHVFNYDLPNIPDTYVHRIGRTGRAGRTGVAISFCNVEELPYLADIEKLIGFAIPEEKKHPWPMQVLQVPDKTAKPQPATRPGQKPKAPKKAEPAKPKQENKARKDNAATKSTEKVADGGKKNKPAKGGDASRPRPAGNKPSQRRGPMQQNPYENRTGGSAIITKRPPWASPPAEENQQGESDMSRNNRRRRGRKGGQNGQPQENQNNQNRAGGGRTAKEKGPAIPKNERGVFDFSEAELAEDQSIKVVSSSNGEVKFASFEDFLKNQ